jgi:hypothetical protein
MQAARLRPGEYGILPGVTWDAFLMIPQRRQTHGPGRPPPVNGEPNNTGKPEGIHIMIGRRSYAAFGNSIGDRQMLEYMEAGTVRG